LGTIDRLGKRSFVQPAAAKDDRAMKQIPWWLCLFVAPAVSGVEPTYQKLGVNIIDEAELLKLCGPNKN